MAKSEVASINYDLKHMDDSIYEIISYEIGEWVLDIMKEDKFIEGLSIMNFDSTIKKTALDGKTKKTMKTQKT